ncbi:MAG: hypothetical protein ACREDS_00300 [Limisphaerales bacterium]
MKLKNKNLFWCARAALAAAFALAGFFSGAEQADHSATTDFSSFQIIAQRNIFDPDRYPQMKASHRSTHAAVPAFSLVGTMDYRKGMFAFFDGTSSDYTKALQRSGTIAGYTVAKITLGGVELQSAGKKIEMKVGQQMRQESEGVWQLGAQSELSATEVESENSTSASDETSAPGSASSSEPNDVLKKLMQQREQELK